MPMLFDGAQLRCTKGKNFCPAAFQPIETFGQRFRPIDICMLFDPVGKNNQLTGKRILGHMNFDIVHGVDIACLHIRKYAGTDRLLSHAAVGSHRPLSLRGAAPVRTHRRKVRTSLQCGFKKETAVLRTCAMSRMPRLGQVKPTIFPLIAVLSGNSFFSSRTVASQTSASLVTEKCCLISTTEGMFLERGR